MYNQAYAQNPNMMGAGMGGAGMAGMGGMAMMGMGAGGGFFNNVFMYNGNAIGLQTRLESIIIRRSQYCKRSNYQLRRNTDY
jgi:hypothetical protein